MILLARSRILYASHTLSQCCGNTSVELSPFIITDQIVLCLSHPCLVHDDCRYKVIFKIHSTLTNMHSHNSGQRNDVATTVHH